jgi:hypothetical protein
VSALNRPKTFSYVARRAYSTVVLTPITAIITWYSVLNGRSRVAFQTCR